MRFMIVPMFDILVVMFSWASKSRVNVSYASFVMFIFSVVVTPHEMVIDICLVVVAIKITKLVS